MVGATWSWDVSCHSRPAAAQAVSAGVKNRAFVRDVRVPTRVRHVIILYDISA